MLNDRLDESISQKYRRKPITRNMDIRITGKNDRPPRRGTGVVCTLRESGTSYNRFLWEITKILGMITMPSDTANRKPNNRNKDVCMILTYKINSFLHPSSPACKRYTAPRLHGPAGGTDPRHPDVPKGGPTDGHRC